MIYIGKNYLYKVEKSIAVSEWDLIYGDQEYNIYSFIAYYAIKEKIPYKFSSIRKSSHKIVVLINSLSKVITANFDL